MQNLNQIRARHALETAQTLGGQIRGAEGGEVIKKIPPTIMNHGLLATLAYSYSEGGNGWRIVFDAMAQHLSSAQIAIIPNDIGNRDQLLDFLVGDKCNSETLKLATSETMAWLEYARRFVRRG